MKVLKGLLPSWNSLGTGHAFSHFNPTANITSQVHCNKIGIKINESSGQFLPPVNLSCFQAVSEAVLGQKMGSSSEPGISERDRLLHGAVQLQRATHGEVTAKSKDIK